MSEQILLYGDLLVEGMEELRINRLRSEQKINEHATLNFEGLIESEEPESFTKKIEVGRNIELIKADKTLFKGIIIHSKLTKMSEIYRVEIEVSSYTVNMDIERKSRSYQNESMTYNELIKDVISGYSSSMHIDNTVKDSVLEKPIIQYEETDWVFLKRVVSHFNTCLIPNVTGDGPRFFIGLSEFNRGELISPISTQMRDFEFYRKLLPETGLSIDDSTFYEVNTNNVYALGDKVIFNEKPLYIIQTTYEYENAVLHNRCILSTRKGSDQRYVPNWNIAGCSIFGEVIDVARDNIKIHLEIDELQEKATAYWYPYATMYASADETGWYCMPEIGDTVRLYHPENEERRAMAINSLKPHDPDEDVEILDPEHRMFDPDVKYIRTAFGKEIKFRPDGIDIIAKDGTVFATLNDNGTVLLNSNDKISFTAENDIEIKARNINVEAKERILIKSNQGGMVDLEEDIIMKGKEIKTVDD